MYIFTCTCGCGQTSDDLGQEFCRLQEGQGWYAKGCEPEGCKAVKELAGGSILEKETEKEDF